MFLYSLESAGLDQESYIKSPIVHGEYFLVNLDPNFLSVLSYSLKIIEEIETMNFTDITRVNADKYEATYLNKKDLSLVNGNQVAKYKTLLTFTKDGQLILERYADNALYFKIIFSANISLRPLVVRLGI